jgi:hypothetical protein
MLALHSVTASVESSVLTTALSWGSMSVVPSASGMEPLMAKMTD